MKKSKQIMNTLTSIAAGITIGLNVFYYHIKITNFAVRIVAVIIMSLLTYATIYFFISWLYTKIIWKRLNKPLYIEGEWYHVHIIDGDEDYMRIGTVDIQQNLYEVKMKGRNYNIKYHFEKGSMTVIDEQCTSWNESCSLDDVGRLVGIYTAERTFGNFSKRTGIHVFELDLTKDFPTIISGSFFDTSPYNRIGVIKLFKSRQQRDEFVKARCESRRYEGKREFASKVNG